MDSAVPRQIWQRASHCCEYCRIPQQYGDSTFEVDHIIPEKT